VADNSRAEESIYSSRGFYGKEEVTVYRQQIAEVLKRVDAGVKLSHCCIFFIICFSLLKAVFEF
jgi:hypothetical protein